MKPDIRRPLGILAILVFAVACGWLAAAGHTPVAIALIAAAAASSAVMSVGMRKRDLQAARRLADLAAGGRQLQRTVKRANEKAAEKAAVRDQRLAERDERLVERVEEMERRLVASFEAERLRAAQRHREEMELLAREHSGA